MTTLSADWDQWIRLNVSRGVPASMLIADMVKNGFEYPFAEAAVAERSSTLDGAADAIPGKGSRLTSDNHIDIDGHSLSVVSRTASPEIVVLDHVLSPEECDELIALSRPKLARSTTIDRSTGREEVIRDRSSEGTFFMRGENPLVKRIEQRLADLTQTPVENAEGLQILHYGVGAEYKPHFDFFEPEYAGSASHLAKGGQRINTTILYLNDVAAGGETIFPEVSLSVTARKGAAVYFSYYDSNGVLDRLTLHGGAPVTRGDKWIATRWCRQRAHQ